MESINCCLQKIIDGQGTLNMKTLGQIIMSHESHLVTEVLSKKQIQEAKFNLQALKKNLPIKGVIKKRFLLCDDEAVTPEMIEEVADTTVKIELQNNIILETLCAKVNLTLGSENCMEMLDMISQAPNSNLGIDQTAMYVEALWTKYWKIVLLYSLLNFI